MLSTHDLLAGVAKSPQIQTSAKKEFTGAKSNKSMGNELELGTSKSKTTYHKSDITYRVPNAIVKLLHFSRGCKTPTQTDAERAKD
ncbi:hypothetical protein M5689_015198 [Euphorbia peplus]|nr:hypothetical protein M5689_015198 [Euphorbia peplus]